MIREILVNIDVDEVARGVAFYRDALGLRLVRHLFDGKVAELAGPGLRLHLLPKPPGTTPAPGAAPRDYARHWTPVHLDLVVDDLDAAVDRAIAAGARQDGPIADRSWGRMAIMADPFGHGFCFLAFSGRGYDEVASP